VIEPEQEFVRASNDTFQPTRDEMTDVATHVELTDDGLIITPADGRTVSASLVWFPRLLNATAKQRQRWQLIGAGEGIHWPDIDEDLIIAGLLRGERLRR
jgi:hypothetical protein